MSIASVKLILKEIELRISTEILLPNFAEFLEQLKHLNILQKEYIKKQVYMLEWDIKSPQVFAALQEYDIICISRYIVKKDTHTAHNILNDLLETEFSLLTEIVLQSFSETSISSQISMLLEQSFSSLIKDLIENPVLVKKNYLTFLRKNVPKICYAKIKQQHLKIFLNYQSNTIVEGLENQKKWFNESIEMNKYPILTDLMNEITDENDLQYLIELIKNVNFTGWKYFLVFLRKCDENYPLVTNKVIKEFLVSREFYCTSSHDGLNIYSKWYKNTIGEMTYKISADEFRIVLRMLIDMVKYEMDTNILDIHIKTSISAPAFGNELVLNFKKFSKERLLEIKNL